MSDPILVTIVTVALIVLSAVCVVMEFALLAARRHRIEELAETSSSARAALRSMNELTLMLAGAQLGITACTFALGAITKPAIDAWLGPVLTGWGVAEWLAGGASFAISLLFVTFLHLVIGEMAPKSWAIAHPERSAMLIGPIAQAYLWPLRPLLRWINGIANRLVAASGVTPADRAAAGGLDVESIRQLVEHSAERGTLDPALERQVGAILDLGRTPIEQLLAPGVTPTSVAADSTASDVLRVARESGHLRLIVVSDPRQTPHVVHARDALLEPSDRPTSELSRAAFTIVAGTPVFEVLARLRAASEQLAVVLDGERVLGVVTLEDMLRRVLPVSARATVMGSDG